MDLPFALDLIPIRLGSKAPRDGNWLRRAYSRQEIEEWVRAGGPIGARLRRTELVIDYDPRNDPDGTSLARLERDLGLDLDQCPTTITPTGGLHVYLSKPPELRHRGKLEGYPGIDLKSAGGQVLVPPSTHPSFPAGPRYRADASRPGYDEIPPAPEALLAAATKPPAPPRERGAGDVTPSHLERILAAVDATEFREHQRWLDTMMGAVAATGGDAEAREVFVRWCVSDPDYAGHEEIIRERWESVDPDGEIGPGTFFHHIGEALGGAEKIPRRPPEEVFDVVPEETTTPAGAPEARILSLILSERGRAVPSHENALRVLDWLDLGPAKNVRTGEVVLRGRIDALEARFPGFRRVIDQDGLLAVRSFIAERAPDGLDFGLDRVHEALQTLGLRQPFDPVQEWLETLAWDGIPRLGAWLSRYAGAPSSPYVQAVGRLFLVAAVARVMRPGIKFDSTLVLEGLQGSGKSTLVRVLGGEYAVEGLPATSSLHDRDVTDAIRSAWFVELDELAAVRRADAETLKAFLSRTTDRARLAYARVTQDFPRRCVFVGTTNDDDYLSDPTGNRRFWPVRTGRVDLEGLAAAREQLFAEALFSWREAPRWEALTLPESLWTTQRAETEERRVRDPWHDAVARLVAVQRLEEITAQDALRELGVGLGQQTSGHWRRLSTVMLGLGWEPSKRVGPNGLRGYRKGPTA